jgi:hypothetical protein
VAQNLWAIGLVGQFWLKQAFANALTVSAWLHFEIGPEQDLRVPFHLRLALPDAEPPRANRYPQYGSRLVIAALLKAIGIAELIDVKPRIERLNRYDHVNVLQIARELSAQVDQTFAGSARHCGNEQYLQHGIAKQFQGFSR